MGRACSTYVERSGVYRVLVGKPGGKRPLRRPRSRWEDNIKAVSQLVKKFPAFYGIEGSLPHSQVPATCPYPEPARSSPYPHIPRPEGPG